MKKRRLEKLSFYNDNHEEFVVSYNMLEDATGYYGVSLEKSFTNHNVIEIESVKGVSDSYEEVKHLLHLLAKFQVTPMSLYEAIDTIYSMEDIHER